MKQAMALVLDSVSFRFAGQEKNFFTNLSVAFPAGALHFLRGQNGAGKSTLFGILQGFLGARDSLWGSITLEGQTCRFEGQERSALQDLSRGVAMVHQAFDMMLADQLSFTRNLQAANFDPYPGVAGIPSHRPLPALVERFRIDLHKPVYLLSGGQRQVLAVLMALQRDARVLLLDEPTAALDQKNSLMVMEFIQELVAQTGITVIIISHDAELVTRYARSGYYEIFVEENGNRRIEFVVPTAR